MKTLNKNKFFESIRYSPHAGQSAVHNSNARFRIVVAGRRFGKSMLASRECMARLIVPNQIVWIVAPTYELTKKVFREVYWGYHKHIPRWIKKSSEAELKIELVNGSIVQCKSADNPVSLIGEGVHFLIIDEAARINEEVWTEALRPTLTDTEGEALLISTPYGMNWFHQLYIRGMDSKEIIYQSWKFPSGSNPILEPSEIKEAERTLPERVFRQEYLAEFISGAGVVFRNIHNCVKGISESYRRGQSYFMAVDLGRHRDYTVTVVVRQEEGHNHVVYFDRFNKIDWSFQRKRIKNASELFGNCRCIVDSTGVGDSVFEDLANDGVNTTPFRISSNQIKCNLIENLAIALENESISFPEIPQLINELQAFSYTTSEATGRTLYNAPSGSHDDCVIALALALRGAKASNGVFVSFAN